MYCTDPETPDEYRSYAMGLFARHAARVFAAHEDVQHLTLLVAQYWDDNANDAVHSALLHHRGDPEWPHECPEEEWEFENHDPTVCGLCSNTVDYLSNWHDNGWAIPAFEAFCLEGSNQEMELHEAYLPYAIASRDANQGVSIEVIGVPVRPWALDVVTPPRSDDVATLESMIFARPEDDGPRQVLADFLQEQGDARGAFIAAQLAGDEGVATGRQRVDYCGALAAVVSAPTAIFERGFPAEVNVQFRDRNAVRDHGRHSAWATVHTIRWREGVPFVTGEMRSLTTVLDHPQEQLWMVLGSARAPHIRELGMLTDDSPLPDLTPLTALRVLRIRTAWRRYADMRVAWSALERLEVVGPDAMDWLLHADQHGIPELHVHEMGLVAELTPDGLHLARSPFGWATRQARRDWALEVVTWVRRARAVPITVEDWVVSNLGTDWRDQLFAN